MTINRSQHYTDYDTWTQYTLPYNLPNSTAGYRTSGVRYRVISRTGDLVKGTYTVTETYLIRASDLRLFIIDTFPPPDHDAITGVPKEQSRWLPGSSAPMCRASKASWKEHIPGLPADPFNAHPGASQGTYQQCLEVSVVYEPFALQNADDPWTYLHIRANAAGEFLHMQSSNVYWETPGNKNKSAMIPATVIVPETEWTVMWPHMTKYNFRRRLLPKLRECMGKINSTSFEVLFNAPKDTIMLVGFEFEEVSQDPIIVQVATEGETELSISDRQYVQVTMKFLEKQIIPDLNATLNVYGHNHFWNPDEGWQVLYINDKTAYQTYNMNQFFRSLTEEEENA